MKYNAKKIALIISTISAIAFLPSCSLIPNYSRPDTALANNQFSTNKLEQETVLDKAWWNGFNSSALVSLQQKGLSQNYNFAAANWQLAQAVAQIRVARAPLFPWLGANSSVSRNGTHSQSNNNFTMNDTVSGNFQASYEVDLWGRLRSQADSAAFMSEATLNDWRAVGLSLESEIAMAYFNLLALKERVLVQQEILLIAQQTLDYIEKEHRAGASSMLDLARQRSDVASMKGRLEDLNRQEQAAKNSLNNLLGTAVTSQELDVLIANDSIMTLTPPTINAGISSDLLQRRPDILSAEASLMAANANIGVARAAFLPVINLTAQGGWQSGELNNLINPSSTLYSLVASLVAPIFEGGRLNAQYEIAVARKEELVARYQQTALSAFLETDTVISANSFLVKEEKNRHEAVNAAQDAYRIVNVQYREGATDFIGLLDAQRTMLSAQDAYITVTLARLNNSVSLFKALGGEWAKMTPEKSNK